MWRHSIVGLGAFMALAVVGAGAMAACKPISISISFSQAAHDFSASLESHCTGRDSESLTRFDLAEADCFAVPKEGGSVELSANEDEDLPSPLLCDLGLLITDSCVPDQPGVTEVPALALLQGSESVELFNSSAPQAVEFSDLSRAFDDDGDGFSNYLEWSEGSDPKDDTATPSGTGDL